MSKYTLMMAPKMENEYSSQVAIVDNSTKIGKGKIEKLVDEGYFCVGYIESDLQVQQLKSGFEHDLRIRVDKAHDLFNQIRAIADSHIDLIF